MFPDILNLLLHEDYVSSLFTDPQPGLENIKAKSMQLHFCWKLWKFFWFIEILFLCHESQFA